MAKRRHAGHELNSKARALTTVADELTRSRARVNAKGICKHMARTRCGGQNGLDEEIAEGDCYLRINEAGREGHIFCASLAEHFTHTNVYKRTGGAVNHNAAQHKLLAYVINEQNHSLQNN